MKERPILFSAPMVRAILAGTKTQTRRVAKLTSNAHVKEPGGNRRWHPDDPDATLACPYGQPGDRLWVRETFAHIYRDNTKPDERRDDDVAYKADHPGLDEYAYGTWKPSIHMPRWASRITLEITGVRVERLQSISEADALAEGITSVRGDAWDSKHFADWKREFDSACAAGCKPPVGPSPATAFGALWTEINGPESWAANPWVWVVEFRRVPAPV